MPSGKKLTLEQFDQVLRLTAVQTSDGKWRHSYREIARRMDLHERTVRQVIRFAAAKLGKLTAWRDDQDT